MSFIGSDGRKPKMVYSLPIQAPHCHRDLQLSGNGIFRFSKPCNRCLGIRALPIRGFYGLPHKILLGRGVRNRETNLLVPIGQFERLNSSTRIKGRLNTGYRAHPIQNHSEQVHLYPCFTKTIPGVQATGRSFF